MGYGSQFWNRISRLVNAMSAPRIISIIRRKEGSWYAESRRVMIASPVKVIVMTPLSGACCEGAPDGVRAAMLKARQLAHETTRIRPSPAEGKPGVAAMLRRGERRVHQYPVRTVGAIYNAHHRGPSGGALGRSLLGGGGLPVSPGG